MNSNTPNEIVNDLRKWAKVLRENHRGFNPEWHAMFAAADLIDSLTTQLAESQRREKAAVEDINSVRSCYLCKHFQKEIGMGGVECTKPCTTIQNENFEYRGVGEREKV